ncbi:MAG: signal recognition particle-docking protein FtsY, partial [Eggerthellaceae bacterium]|nr:signal recognition particle-docking protein FtsY [Eggerthellaceae bacterium]
MWERVKAGMSRTRQRFTERMNVLLDRGPDVDDEFWDGLEEALILSDVGALTASEIVEEMREEATRKALPDAYAVMDTLTDRIADTFTQAETNIFDEDQAVVLFVGINGAGKTTTVGKIAYEAKARGRNVLLGCGDTFRAAAIEQLEEWGRRANVEIVERERGSDPASVCFETIERAEVLGSDLVLIDTAGRLHTSSDLMRELQKVVNVVRKRSKIPVRTVLVIDATTGQNGLSQAREFNRALDLDAVIVTKLDGTAKGGIALAVSHELELPIAKVGVGERLEDLQDFDARDFAAALIGAEPEYESEEPQLEQEPKVALEDQTAEPEPMVELAGEPVEEPAQVAAFEPEVQEGP